MCLNACSAYFLSNKQGLKFYSVLQDMVLPSILLVHKDQTKHQDNTSQNSQLEYEEVNDEGNLMQEKTSRLADKGIKLEVNSSRVDDGRILGMTFSSFSFSSSSTYSSPPSTFSLVFLSLILALPYSRSVSIATTSYYTVQ